MELSITGRNLTLDNSLKEYIHKKFDKLEHLYKRVYRCEVILEDKKLEKKVEIILHLKRNRVTAKESSLDLYTSIDNASENIRKQLRRLNGRIFSKRRRDVSKRIVGFVTRFRAEKKIDVEEPSGNIIKENFFAEKPMLPDEARLELEMMKRSFLMFENADTGKANVIYKKNDGNYGLIEQTF